MSAPPNPYNAIVLYLRANADVAAITTNGFVAELPQSLMNTEAPTAYTITPAGGVPNALDNSPVRQVRFDVKAWSQRPEDAFALADTIYLALKRLWQYVDVNGCMVYNVVAALPYSSREQNDWPVSQLLGNTARVSILRAS